MKPRSVIVDVAIDQGGCIETIHETTHDDPVYEVHGVHPLRRRQHARRGAAHVDLRAHQRHAALSARRRRSTAPAGAARRDPALALGVNTVGGQVTNEPVAEFLGVEFVEPLAAFADARAPRHSVRPHGDACRSSSTCRRSRLLDLVDRSSATSEHGGTVADAARQSWIARNPFGYSVLHYDDVVAVLRDKRWHSAVESDPRDEGITDPKFLDRQPDVDPVGRGRRAHPPAPARRQGVLAARRRPAAAVHARGHRRARRRGRRRPAGPTSPSTSASRTRSRSSASCSARRRRTGSCSAAGPADVLRIFNGNLARGPADRSSRPRTSSTSTPGA